MQVLIFLVLKVVELAIITVVPYCIGNSFIRFLDYLFGEAGPVADVSKFALWLFGLLLLMLFALLGTAIPEIIVLCKSFIALNWKVAGILI